MDTQLADSRQSATKNGQHVLRVAEALWCVPAHRRRSSLFNIWLLPPMARLLGSEKRL